MSFMADVRVPGHDGPNHAVWHARYGAHFLRSPHCWWRYSKTTIIYGYSVSLCSSLARSPTPTCKPVPLRLGDSHHRRGNFFSCLCAPTCSAQKPPCSAQIAEPRNEKDRVSQAFPVVDDGAPTCPRYPINGCEPTPRICRQCLPLRRRTNQATFDTPLRKPFSHDRKSALK